MRKKTHHSGCTSQPHGLDPASSTETTGASPAADTRPESEKGFFVHSDSRARERRQQRPETLMNSII